MTPVDYRNYPKNWQAIRAFVLDRAGHKCEQCGVPNHAVITREGDDQWHEVVGEGTAELVDGMKTTRIVLTVHHTCFDPSCDDMAHLQALCQLHHFRADADHHQRNAAETRRRNRIERGQMEMTAVAS